MKVLIATELYSTVWLKLDVLYCATSTTIKKNIEKLKQGLLSVAVCGLLIVLASLVTSLESRAHGVSSCGSQAVEHRISSCRVLAQLLHDIDPGSSRMKD